MTRKIRTYIVDENMVSERREHIANNAIELFLIKGFKGTTVREIAKKCNMTPGSLYNYIGTKEDILHLICEISSQKWRPNLEEVIVKYKNCSVTKILRECIKVFFYSADKASDTNLFFNREIHNFSPSDRKTLLASESFFILFFNNVLEMGIKTGEFEMNSTICVAHNIDIAAYDWSLRQWFLRQYFTLEQYIEVQTEFFLNAIKTKRD